MRVSWILAGVLSLLIAAGHTWWGQTNAMPALSALPTLARASFEVSWHQVGATLAVGGVALVLAGFGRIRSPAVPGFVMAAYGANVAVFGVFVASRYREVFAATIPQFIAFALMMLLIGVGLARSRRDPAR